MHLHPGAKLGPYEILSALGRGGMGEVWKARDTRLNRTVAIKTSRIGFSGRFQKEAQSIAALNHPHVCTLYDVGPDYLVMEFIEGQTLTARLDAGPISSDEALRIAGQIADALQAAHEKNIVHRDLKPSNVIIRSDGSLKVLDFGLAKIDSGAAALDDTAATMNLDNTDAGAVMGTVGYMSPEQARGRAVDKRTDIWAFGVVVYEMVTAKRLFQKDTIPDSMAAVLKDAPDLSLAPENMRKMLACCLEKDPSKRLRDIGDWQFLLAAPGEVSNAAPRRMQRWPGMLAVAATLFAVLAGWLYLRPPAEARTEMRTDIATPTTTDPYSFALSPDGKNIAFIASGDGPSRLWVRALDESSAQPVNGTEDAHYPFWSPNGRSIGFFADGKVKRIDIGQGPPQTLADVGGINIVGGSWSRNDAILFGRGAGEQLFRINAGGGGETALSLGNKDSHRDPRFLPDGKHFLFFTVGGHEGGIYLASVDGAKPKRLTTADSAGEYMAGAGSSTGWLVFIQRDTLVARRLDTGRGELIGETLTLARPVGTESVSLAGAFSVAQNGLLAYRPATASRRKLLWFQRSGLAAGAFSELDESGMAYPQLSPDGKRTGLTRGSTGSAEIWQVEDSRAIRFTFDPADDRFAIWSPDGSQIVFASNRTGVYNLYQKAANGAGSEQVLLATPEGKRPDSWSPDGRFLLYWSFANGGDLMLLPMTGDRKPIPFLSSPSNEQQGQFSPDGKWVAYQSNESGRDEVYVRPFPGPGGQWQISTGGGISPRWRRDGGELYYVAPDRMMMAVSVKAQGGSLSPEKPVALFRTAIAAGGARPQYDVAADGRFLINAEMADNAAPITLLQNWRPGAKPAR